MKAGVIQLGGEAVVVMPAGERWINITRAALDHDKHVEGVESAPLRSVGDLIARGLFNRSFYRRILEFVQRHGRLAEYTLPELPAFSLPLRPGKVVCIGRNYRAHVQELGHDLPPEPMFFGKVASACIGPEEAIIVKDWYGRVDHEGELGVVIGKRAKDVPEEDVQAFIAGYTLVNDVTAREMQKNDIAAKNPWFRAKNLDTFCPVGPTVVMAEVFGWPLREPVELRVNGAVRQQGNTEMFIFGLPRLIAHVTRFVTLEPGDILATGTPEGVSPIVPGDLVELLHPEIGVLRNPVR
jgi:5-oxopent-3-ene-1,2,5-tricarboxylate decarboxylase/2-hydroxyhepta-2,4-diene-1,7-dioate isomerase